MRSDVRGAWVAALASLAVHAMLAVFLVTLPPTSSLVARAAEVEIDLASAPAVGDGETGSARVARAAAPAPGGGTPRENVDARDRGRGGDRRGASRVIVLLPHADAVLLQDSPMNAWRDAQTQRIRTADNRASRDSRRATPSPDVDPFLASGDGAHPERRPIAATDARTGARVAPRESELGQTRTAAPELRGPELARAEGSLFASAGAYGTDAEHSPLDAAHRRMRQGTSVSSPGRGILEGRGERESEAARVARGRPPVDEGPAATQARSVDARIRDDQDAELLAAEMVQSLVESSPRSGPDRGQGAGGTGGGGAPGTGGGAAEGGRAHAVGPGSGEYPALDTSDARYVRWYLQVRERVGEHLEFPRERALAMDQGLSVYSFTVRRDGALVGEPELVRLSGFADFDTAGRRAIERAAPFPPLPPELAEGLSTHAVRMTVEHSNPMVH